MATEQRERQPRPAFLIYRGTNAHEILLGTEDACFTVGDAVDFIQQRPEFWHHVIQPLELPYLRAKPLGDRLIPTSVRLSIPGKTVTLPRKTGERGNPGVPFQTHRDHKYQYTEIVNLIFEIGDYYEDPDLDRGRAWVGVGENPAISYSLSPRKRSDEELKGVFNRVNNYVSTTIMNYLGESAV